MISTALRSIAASPPRGHSSDFNYHKRAILCQDWPARERGNGLYQGTYACQLYVRPEPPAKRAILFRRTLRPIPDSSLPITRTRGRAPPSFPIPARCKVRRIRPQVLRLVLPRRPFWVLPQSSVSTNWE